MKPRDKRGSADLFQVVLVLPIVVALLYGSFEIWKIIAVKQSLSAATYQAARCLSRPSYTNPYRCYELLRNELLNNSWLDENDVETVAIRYYDQNNGRLSITDLETLGCWERFSVEAEMFLPWPVLIRDLMENPTLMSRHTNYVECGPTFSPTPTPTPGV